MGICCWGPVVVSGVGNGLGDGEDGRIRLSSVDIAGGMAVKEGGIEDRQKCWHRGVREKTGKGV